MRKYQSVKTLWLSDLHLGSRNAKAHLVLEFLENIECETLFLVGDIVDFKIKRNAWHWTKDCERIITRFAELSRDGVKVVYLPGNHDSELRLLNGGAIYGIEIVNEAVHVTEDNRRFLVTHGDGFEHNATTRSLSDRIGGHLYDYLMALDRWYCWWLTVTGYGHWSLAKKVKLKIPAVQRFFQKFSAVATAHANDNSYDGVICGHTHNPEITQLHNIWYCNTGDWVESCCALTEDAKGHLELIHYTGHRLTNAQNCKYEPPLSATTDLRDGAYTNANIP